MLQKSTKMEAFVDFLRPRPRHGLRPLDGHHDLTPPRGLLQRPRRRLRGPRRRLRGLCWSRPLPGPRCRVPRAGWASPWLSTPTASSLLGQWRSCSPSSSSHVPPRGAVWRSRICTGRYRGGRAGTCSGGGDNII